MPNLSFKLTTLAQWSEVVKTLIPHLTRPILLLKGNLGAGKTTFTKELVSQLGSTDPVSSPTYALVNTYQTAKGKIYHFDLYRLNSLEEVYGIGIEEYLDEPGAFCIIEWPEVFESELDQGNFHELKIENTQQFRDVFFN